MEEETHEEEEEKEEGGRRKGRRSGKRDTNQATWEGNRVERATRLRRMREEQGKQAGV